MTVALLTEPFVGVYSPRATTDAEEYKKYFDAFVQPVLAKKQLESVRAREKSCES